VKLQGRTRNILLQRHSDEITKMAQFHSAIITNSYQQSRILVFRKPAIRAHIVVVTTIR
jgi:hypothetical protein